MGVESSPLLSELAALTAYNKKKAYAGHSKLLVDKDFNVLDTYFAEPYIQHNPNLVNGLESLREFKKANVPRATTTILRCFADRDLVFFQEKVEGLGHQAFDFWDIYRLEDGMIVEHWDNHQLDTGPNPNTKRTLFDGPTESSGDPSYTETTRALVIKLVNNVFVCRKHAELAKYASMNVIQHAKGVDDGVGAWIQSLKVGQWFTGDIQYDAIRKVVAEGNFAVTCSQGTLASEPYQFWDMWRVEDNKVVERWHVSSKIVKSRLNRNPTI